MLTLRKNALAVKDRLNNALFCAVVKDDAYGHGAPEVASALYDICDYYAVRSPEEGALLRISGIDKPILVLVEQPEVSKERAALYDLSLTVASISSLMECVNLAVRLNKRITIHLKYNTGMNRQGADSLAYLEELVFRAKSFSHLLAVEGVYSHFADPSDDAFTSCQYERFLSAAELVKDNFPSAVAHIAASGGLLKNKTLDMARIGLLLYGYKPFESDIEVAPVMSAFLRVIARREVDGRIGYGNYKYKGQATLIDAGYADGLLRRGDNRCLNNLCMDVSFLRGNVEGGEFELIGKDYDAEKLAAEWGTCPYEVLCLIGGGAKERIYL